MRKYSLKIKPVDYEIDEAMMGSEWNEKDDLTLFCEILQTCCNERCIFVNVVEITDSYNGASDEAHRREDTHEELFYVWETLGIDKVWEEALEKYSEAI